MVMVAVRAAVPWICDLETVAGAQGRLLRQIHRLGERDGAARQAQRVQHAGALGSIARPAPVETPSAPPYCWSS